MKVIFSHYITRMRRKAGEFLGKVCVICGKPERMEHHPDYDRPHYTIPVCCDKHHKRAQIRFE